MTNTEQQIIKENINLIYSIVNKYSSYYDIDDLLQVASIGIIMAYRNYNNNYDVKFSTYAYKYIFGEVYKYVNDFKNFKISKDYLKINKKVQEAKNILTQKLMREPSNHELSLFLEIDEQLLNEIENLSKSIDSLDRPLKEEDNLYLSDIVASKEENNLDNIYLYQEINKLNNEEKKLLISRYFLDKTQNETSKILGINQVQVSRFEKKILKKLKNNMVEYGKK